MTLAPPAPAAPQSPASGLPPLLLPPGLKLSPEQFARVCEANPEAVLEGGELLPGLRLELAEIWEG